MRTTEPETRHRPDPAGAQPLPMAVGVLALPPATRKTARQSALLDLTLLAYKLGYFLFDLVEVTPDADPSAYTWIEMLATQTDADALICAGPVDRTRLDEIATRIHMVIRTVPLTGEETVGGSARRPPRPARMPGPDRSTITADACVGRGRIDR